MTPDLDLTQNGRGVPDKPALLSAELVQDGPKQRAAKARQK
jgi:hypothetical protein